MKITFLTPGYVRAPSGGIRVVYEYANRLVELRHEVTVVHPRQIDGGFQSSDRSLRHLFRGKLEGLRDRLVRPKMTWMRIDPRVRILFVPNADSRFIPPGDAIFATACFTVDAVVRCPREAGEKFYLIQGYETWMRPKAFVDATWLLPLHKIVVSKWLLEIGEELGSSDMVYIPNGIDHDQYKCVRPIRGRSPQIAMTFSKAPIKGSEDGINALELARKQFPDLKAVMFGLPRRDGRIPKWIEYHQNPPQDFIVNEIYNNSSIFLSASWSEGFALPPAEAACCGCAVVATDSGGIRDYIEQSVTGLLSAPKDSPALARNLCRLIEDDEQRVQLATACHNELKRFEWERSTTLLEEALAKRTNRIGFPHC